MLYSFVFESLMHFARILTLDLSVLLCVYKSHLEPLIYKNYLWLILCTKRSDLCQDSLYIHTFFGGGIFCMRWLAGNLFSFN
jgi:hypothetical protein